MSEQAGATPPYDPKLAAGSPSRPPGEIATAVAHIGSALEAIGRRIESLEDSLSDVLEQGEPPESATVAVETGMGPTASVLGARLNDLIGVAEALAGRIASIDRRLRL